MADEEVKTSEAIPEAEKAIAEVIKGVPEVTSNTTDGQSVYVYAACEEGLSAEIEQQIVSGLRQAIKVAFIETREVLQTRGCCLAKCVFRVSIVTPVLLSRRPNATVNLACAIIRRLNGICFASPFAPQFPVVFDGWSHWTTNTADKKDKTRESVLDFVAPIILQAHVS